MCSVAKPIIKQIRDNREALDFFETVSLPAEDEKTQAIIMNFPTVYIHYWQDSGAFEVYVGETNNIFKRTRQHYDAALNQPGWHRYSIGSISKSGKFECKDSFCGKG